MIDLNYLFYWVVLVLILVFFVFIFKIFVEVKKLDNLLDIRLVDKVKYLNIWKILEVIMV